MAFAADPALMEWLFGDDFEFDWDEGNASKSETKHGFSTDEIESIFDEDFYFVGVVVRDDISEKRGLILGVTCTGKFAALVFCKRNNKLRPISCRAMRKKEKEIFFMEVMQ